MVLNSVCRRPPYHQLKRRLILAFPVIWMMGLVRCTAWAAELQDPLRLEDVPRIAREQREEIAAAQAQARARAAEQCPAIVSALEDPMLSPAIDHYPYEMVEGGGRRYDWSLADCRLVLMLGLPPATVLELAKLLTPSPPLDRARRLLR